MECDLTWILANGLQRSTTQAIVRLLLDWQPTSDIPQLSVRLLQEM